MINNQADLDLLMSQIRAGKPAVATSTDHVAVIRPDQDLSRLTSDRLGELVIAQAGAKNFSRGLMSDVDGWRSTNYRTVQFFINDGDVSLQSFNYPGYRIRHRYGEAFIDPINNSELFRLDSSFRVRPGLADPSAVSFVSLNYPGYFLRHQNSRLVLSPNDGSELFRQDATFLSARGSPVRVAFHSSP